MAEAEIPESYHIELTDLPPDSLMRVLDRHLSYYSVPESIKQALAAKRPQIVHSLNNAYNIDRFAHKLSKTQGVDDKTLADLIEVTTNVLVETRRWFSTLSLNQRFYAMLVGLCPDLDKDKLWLVYERMVAALQTKKVELSSPLNFSEEDLLSATGTQTTEIGSLVFENPMHRDFVLAQAKQSYLQQFRFLLPTFAEVVVQHSDKRLPENIDVRVALAAAVGEIGKTGWEHLLPILSGWASHDGATVRTSVAHALRQTAGEHSRKDDILALLRRWQSSGNPRLRWTVAATLERLYPYIPNEAFRILNTLAADTNSHVRSAVAHALSAIARRDLENVLSLIDEWIIDQDSNRRRTAASTFLRLTGEGKRGQLLIRRSEEKARALPILAEICKEGGTQLGKVMNILRQWVMSGDKELQQAIEDTLLDVCEKEMPNIREALVAELTNNWAEGENEEVYKFSVVLIDRIRRLPSPLEFEPDQGGTDEPPDFEIHGIVDDWTIA
jgi:3-methyladenine DNA glycosylase AlkC